jgi:hypothetical protein
MILRVVAYAFAGIAAVLLTGTVTGDRYALFTGRTGIFLLGIVIGLSVSAIRTLIGYSPRPLGCFGFGIVALAIGSGLAFVLGLILPDVEVSLTGAVVAGVFAAVTGSIVYAMFDEGGPAERPAIEFMPAPAAGAEEDDDA